MRQDSSLIRELVAVAAAHSGLPKRVLAKRAKLAPETLSRLTTRGTADFATVAAVVDVAGMRLVAVPKPPASPASDHRRLDARSLAMHALIAVKLLTDPSLVDKKVLPTLRRFSEIHAGTGTATLFEQWGKAARGGVRELVRLCTDTSERGAQLRQATPMTGILTQAERRQLYESFAA